MFEDLQRLLDNPTIAKLVIVVVGITIVSIIIRFLKKGLARYVPDTDNWYRTKKALNMVGYISVVLLIVMVYSDRLGQLTVILGVAGAGLAFALQEVIISIAGWVAIMIGGIFKTGDRVMMGGVIGDVIDFSMQRTTIMEVGSWVDGDLYNGKIVRVANSFVFKQPVENYSSDFPFLWDEIKLPIRYGSDYDYLRAKLCEIIDEQLGDFTKTAQKYWGEMVRKYLLEDASTSPMVTIVANDNWVEFTLRYVVDYRNRRYTQDLLYTRILNELAQNPDKAQMASTTIQLVDLPPIDIGQ
ncbi:MAG: mechanosensitive ion channel family protein [Firmicutes bacterium]|nr:mechanosensitive ion channel family protein [Bacillota bacterium]